jgi:syntaxin-binding protein 1
MLATGLDEDYKKPKGLADQVVRMLDEEDITPPDRLRLLILYILYRDGILKEDTQKLLAHAQLPASEETIIRNLELLGARTSRGLKDPRPGFTPMFPRKPPPMTMQDEYALSRYEPVLQEMLEAAAANTLSPETFPYTKPPLDMGDVVNQASATSLRTAKPTWARGRSNVSTENKQRCIVFIAGGATYSESRVCYEVGRKTGREVFLVTSHMLTPTLFARQVADLTTDKRRLGIPAEQPKQQAPAHLFEPDAQPTPPLVAAAAQPKPSTQPQGPRVAPPTQQMGAMNLGGGTPGRAPQANSSAKLTKEPEKEKKKHRFFGKKDKDKDR